MTDSKDTPDLVMSFLAVRRALGFLGLALPVVLFAWAVVSGTGLQPSISEFYHTPMGDLLVGILVAIGVFLITYKGYPREAGERLSDRVISTVAGLGAIGVALFPVAPVGGPTCPPTGAVQGFTFHWCSVPSLHFASAGVFFLCLAVFCFCLFPRGDQTSDGRIDWTAPKNRLYAGCGTAIVLSILALGLYAVSGPDLSRTLASLNFVYWMETVGVIAFAISWLAKGKVLEGVSSLMDR